MYVAFRLNRHGDDTPYAYKTTDYGKTWTPIVNGTPREASRCASCEPIPLGAACSTPAPRPASYVSFDDGANWQTLSRNLPAVPVADLEIQHDDLYAATEGRAFWALDDLSALRQMTGQGMTAAVYLFTPRCAQCSPAVLRPRRRRRVAIRQPVPTMLLARLGARLRGHVQARVPRRRGEDAPEVRASSGPAGAPAGGGGGFGPPPRARLEPKGGLNAFQWDLRAEPPTGRCPATSRCSVVRRTATASRRASIRCASPAGSTVLTQSFDVVGDPRLSIPAAEVAAHDSMARAINGRVAEINDALIRIRDVKDQVTRFVDRSKDAPNAAAISAKGKAIGQKADTLGPKLSTKAANGQDIINFRNGMNAQYVFLLGNLEGNDVVTQPVRDRFAELEKLWSALKTQVNVLELQDVPDFNKLLGEGKVEGVIVPKPKPKVIM